jgi:hypothetical protein
VTVVPDREEEEGPDEEAAGEVVQLAAESPRPKRTGKANPVGAQVLVRREAAREAHEFRREKHSQADWDDHAEPARGAGGFRWLMERFPKGTIFVTMLLTGCLIVWTILAMEDMFTIKDVPVDNTIKTRTTALSEYYDDDPEAAIAEVMARGFLNATTAEAAATFVFESEAIREKLDQFFTPIAQPGNYELSLKSRALTSEGQSVFAFDVSVPGLQTRRLVVIPEGRLPKVYWQFFAEVGDMSWDEFLTTKPPEPVEMLVLVHPGEKYVAPYDQAEWQSYHLHDWSEKRQIYAFADRGTSEYWRIEDGLKSEPVKFPRHVAVMALVKMAYMADLPIAADGRPAPVVEIKEVISTSRLPQRFRPSGGKK